MFQLPQDLQRDLTSLLLERLAMPGTSYMNGLTWFHFGDPKVIVLRSFFNLWKLRGQWAAFSNGQCPRILPAVNL